MLKEIISAIDGSFHRVFGVIMQNLLANQGRKAIFVNEHAELVKAARDYVPHLVLVATWIEYHIRMRETHTMTLLSFTNLSNLKIARRIRRNLGSMWDQLTFQIVTTIQCSILS
jgi:hypothetical protein